MKKFTQFFKFCVTGGLGVVTDAGIYHLLKILLNAEKSDFLLYIIPVFGYFAAVVQNYLINHFWTFNEQTKNERISLKSFFVFLTVSLTSLLPRYLTYWFVLNYFYNPRGHLPDIANLAGIVVGALVNFLGSKFIVFKAKK